MGIDRTTPIQFSVWFNNNKEFLKRLEELHIDLVGEKDHKEKNQLLIGDELGAVKTETYYFDDSEATLNYSGYIGDTYVGFTIPISDEVLTDILQYSIKRLNKLKTALESLK